MALDEDNSMVVIDALSKQILKAMRQCAAEEHEPMHTADEMDRVIAEARERFTALRKLREDYEYIATALKPNNLCGTAITLSDILRDVECGIK
jgi:hypothetical protein